MTQVLFQLNNFNKILLIFARNLFTLIRLYKIIWWFFITLICVVPLAISGAVLYLNHTLPPIDTIRDVQLQIPLRVYSKDYKLIAEFGEMRRSPIPYKDIPPNFINALLAAEDDNFRNHYGIDLKSLLRAALELVTTGHKQSGGSTITMQVARNYFLSSEQTYTRKAKEILLALKIEQELTKDEILELYLNKIFLGYRAYGIEAASQIYYGKSVKDLTLAQMATLAGLPKAPSANNPIINPERSLARRNWILSRMFSLKMITKQEYETAKVAPETAKRHDALPELAAPYVAEMVRAEMINKYSESAYTDGYQVVTTVPSTLQTAANVALRKGLLEYDRRHGYRGAEQKILEKDQWLNILKTQKSIANLEPAIVSAINDQSITIINQQGKLETVEWETMKWARPYLSANSVGVLPKGPKDVVAVGDLIRIQRDAQNNPQFSQLPLVESALVSLDSQTGAVEALVGGFSFDQSNYNRVIQAKRQPGSSFKPFIYSAALDTGFTAASMINDAPIVVDDGSSNKKWKPKNDGNKFLGPITLREGLYRSRNLVTIRLLQSIGIDTALDYIARFGFDRNSLPPSLSLSLGAADVTPMQIARAWTIFANGGYKTYPYIIDQIIDRNNTIIFTATPPIIPSETLSNKEDTQATSLLPIEPNNEIIPAIAESVIDKRTAYIMNSILQDVVRRGTATRALVLKRTDLAGKTGTTNDTKDTWFAGYNADYTTIVWVGFDQPKTLGRREYGGTLALPIWIDYMATALKDKPMHMQSKPAGLVQLKIDADTGRLASEGSQRTFNELFKKEDNIQGSDDNNANLPISSDDVAPMELF